MPIMEYYLSTKRKGVLTGTCYNMDEPLKKLQSERNQTQKSHIVWFDLCEMFRICRFIDRK